MERNRNLDFAKFLAICCVVLLHVITGVSDTRAGDMTESQMTVYNIIKSLCEFAVPVFLMVSGSLLLNPDKEITLKKLVCGYIRRIALAILIFCTTYCLIELVATNHGFSFSMIGTALFNMITGNSWGAMWYLYMLLGLYLILPLLKLFTKYADMKMQLFVLAGLFIFTSVLPEAKRIWNFELGIMFPIEGIYVFYFLAGSFIIRFTDAIKYRFIAIITISLVIVWNVVNYVFAYKLMMDYSSPATVLLSLGIFTLIQSLSCEFKISGKLCDYVFGIYLVHTVFINFSYKFLNLTPLLLGGYVLIPVFWIVTLALSILAVFILRQIPFFKKYIL